MADDAEAMAAAAATFGRWSAEGALGLTPDQIDEAMAMTTWGSVEGMILREFLGDYAGFTPSCRMDVPHAKVIAEVFDAAAAFMRDKRRAVRHGRG